MLMIRTCFELFVLFSQECFNIAKTSGRDTEFFWNGWKDQRGGPANFGSRLVEAPVLREVAPFPFLWEARGRFIEVAFPTILRVTRPALRPLFRNHAGRVELRFGLALLHALVYDLVAGHARAVQLGRGVCQIAEAAAAEMRENVGRSFAALF